MTWTDGLNYATAQTGEDRMKQETLANAVRIHPPRLPPACDTRMADNTATWEASLTNAPDATPEHNVSAKAGKMTNGLTFSEWLEASKHYEFEKVASPHELRMLRQQTVPESCFLTKRVVGYPLEHVVFVLVVGLAIGAAYFHSKKSRVTSPANIPPLRPIRVSTHVCDEHGCKPIGYRGPDSCMTVEKMMSYLGTD